ncbi:MAG: ATP cone domain-containing protein [Minisyncoccia bacterium]|jgi:transcriptional regulator NrdR family protein
MAKQVIKKGGKREPFRAEKLKKSVRMACKDAHVGAVCAKRVVTKVAGPVLRFAAKRKTVKVATLRKKVLAGLRKVEPKAAKAWLRYERRHRARRRR